ncbi:MAG TPA: ClpXP protease specificity-enhancing factor [Cellvibrio sp.]|nr:ClpXP protease specificity-enhancing factor [Cellvibrio sp.]
MQMTSNRPYLLRAIYEWLVDNNCTPHLVVFARAPGVEVPQQHINKDGQIILNISPSAVKDLFIANEAISFNARFSGVVNNIHVPCGAVLGIYGRENGQGMMFEFEGGTEPPEPPSADSAPAKSEPAKRPSLKVVK